MLEKIIQFSIKNKLIIGLFTISLIIIGVVSLQKLPIDAVPDITDNQVMIITSSPTLAAQEVEQLVTFPIEQTMVNIPDIEQLRSFSRFGLSIVTIVFKDKVDIYWARQQVQERLSMAANGIPDGIGTPEMAPISTGLGEIFQYIVHTEAGYEDKYSLSDLRTIQDWIIKRQLLGTPGVAEVSGLGGYTKQYQIVIDPDKLNSKNIDINEIFNALERNNQNTGGAYIEKNPYSYFIRSEGLIKNIEDIEKIVVSTTSTGVPILIRDLASVEFGHSIRYGAVTRNGEGEAVSGIVLMLKGENSSEVINNVKAKIEQIKTTLPEGVTIEPYLDRKKLVDNAIGTVSKNLIEGALIVIFVLILFLGNIRGGLIVASVIPLSMLFAISMMSFYGVSGNLMSLGAIDFGLIVDGTVIIVEAVMHGILVGQKKYQGIAVLSRQQMDTEVFNSASKIRTSAAFGEIIILIVYLPLWFLTGIEGKMFTPMAQTVSFAILGAFILSLTYVPMMSALFLSRKIKHKANFSDRMMSFIHKIYEPILDFTLKHKIKIIVLAFLLLLVSIFEFTRLGSEFIPQLDEGDFALSTSIPTGSSLQQSIDVSLKAQKILHDNFPEVLQTVSKIGSGEIPTDPMPIEAGDMMVILKPRSEWESAETKEELAERMQDKLSIIPNASFGFLQPIQMRFNELMTGAKQDVVIKIYGEDLDILTDLSQKIGGLIGSIEGVNDLYLEKITGLPQIQIHINRNQLAKYGLDIQTVNRTIQIGFAGQAAGQIYEGERRFDLVVRLSKATRSDIEDVKNLLVKVPAGFQVPLSELAEIAYKPAPVQIQRDDAKRRIIIGFNVRNRDVKSIVNDVRNTINANVEMPAGYYVTYGGQFENLQAATRRLSIALPIALFLIFVLLYFTFGSIKQSFLIFTAIPLSAIGGVFALLLRDMPFSISAGVGFIALFGVAVLNGIVLIGEFNSLEKSGMTDVYQRVKEGTKVRLRPVLMTAMVASMGFLPMALSTSSGAEVQRPLATVVIGGLLTATILTLIVLPILYILFNKSSKKRKISVAPVIILFAMMLFSQQADAQELDIRTITLEQAENEAVSNNTITAISKLMINQQVAAKKGVVNLSKTEISYGFGTVSTPGVYDDVIGISQTIDFPILYANQAKLAKAKIEQAESYAAIQENILRQEVRNSYWQCVYVAKKIKLYERLNEIYENLSNISQKRYESGETRRLQSVSSSVQAMQINNKLQQFKADLSISQRQLQTLLNTKDNIVCADTALPVLILRTDSLNIQNNLQLEYLQKELQSSIYQTKIERNGFLPSITVGVNSQTYNHTEGVRDKQRFSSFSVGLAIPLFPGGNRAKIQAAKFQETIQQSQIELAEVRLENQLWSLVSQSQKLYNSVLYYQKKAIPQADLIVVSSNTAFKQGDISYTEHLQNLTLSTNIYSEYLDVLLQYNQSIIEIESFMGY